MDEQPIIPGNNGRWRACLRCKLIKTVDEFDKNGCENCEELGDKWSQWTTPSFTGIIALMNDDKSWVAKYQRIRRLRPGLYAIAVKGNLGNDNENDEYDDGYEE